MGILVIFLSHLNVTINVTLTLYWTKSARSELIRLEANKQIFLPGGNKRWVGYLINNV